MRWITWLSIGLAAAAACACAPQPHDGAAAPSPSASGDRATEPRPAPPSTELRPAPPSTELRPAQPSTEPRPAPPSTEPRRDCPLVDNPHLFVQADGVLLSVGAVDGPGAHVSIDDLADALASIPDSRWPCGKVIMIQAPGVLPAEDTRKITANMKACEAIAKRLGLQVIPGPS